MSQWNKFKRIQTIHELKTRQGTASLWHEGKGYSYHVMLRDGRRFSGNKPTLKAAQKAAEDTLKGGDVL